MLLMWLCKGGKVIRVVWLMAAQSCALGNKVRCGHTSSGLRLGHSGGPCTQELGRLLVLDRVALRLKLQLCNVEDAPCFELLSLAS